MAYKKPKVVAKSIPKQSFAAGCPANSHTSYGTFNNCRPCRQCELNY